MHFVRAILRLQLHGKVRGIDSDPDPDPDPDNPGAGNGPDFVRSQSPDMPSPHVRYALAHGVRWSLPGQGLSGLRSDHSRLL